MSNVVSINSIITQNNKRQLNRDCLFAAGLVLGFFFLLWKSKYGTGAYDEPFYLTIPHRILKGDGMFSEEWNFGQFSAFLMLPVMKFYLLVIGTTEGIILNFRYIYILFQTICTILIYVKLRRKTFGWAAAWCFYLFCPYDIMALSYNTMGIAFMTITGVLLATAGKNSIKSWCFSGILFAAAVLCNPFLAVIYFLYTLLVAVVWWKERRTGEGEREKETGKRNKKGNGKGNFCIKAWGCITAGAGALAVVFVITVLAGSPVHELLLNIPLLMQDPEHTSRSVFMVGKVYLQSFWNVYGWFVPVWAVLLFIAYLYRKDEAKRKIGFVLISLSCILCLIGLLPGIQNNYNFIMVPVAVCGAAAYIMTEDKDTGVFRYLFLFGLVYSFMANYASNQGMHAISMAMVPADVAAVLLIGEFTVQKEKTRNRKRAKGTEKTKSVKNAKKAGDIIAVSAAALLLVQLGVQIYAKSVHAFWEEPVWKLQTRIEEGPLKGTVTTEEKAERYKRLLEDIKTHIRKEGPVLFVTEDTWCYLYADAQYGTFSSYLSGGFTQAEEKWELYFGAHPDKIPDYICFPIAEMDMDQGAEVKRATEKYGYDVELSKESYHLYKNK